MKRKRLIISTICVLFILGCSFASITYYYLFAPQFHLTGTTHLYIDQDDTTDSVYHKVAQKGNPRSLNGFRWMMKYKNYEHNIHTGCYAIHPNENVYHVFSRLLRGYQEPVNLTIGSVRTIERLARNIGRQLMIDSIDISKILHDTIYIKQLGFSQETLPALFIPNTYQVYWNTTAKGLIERIQKEYNRFWNSERKTKAQEIGLHPIAIATLASIVEEETNNKDEKPMVAGLYINRLRQGIPLQADPTIKFALQDFNLRRINNTHLNVDSPYNTYKHLGLPPGPIRIPTPASIDAVLNYTKHNFLYMCAKEDFSGTHNFASTLTEHMKNARKYWNALNKRKIYK